MDSKEIKVTHYVGVLDGSAHVWGVRIPDVPGCVGGGAAPEAAISDAASALKDVMAHKQSGGYSVPRASSWPASSRPAKIAEGESAVTIPLLHD
jgi:predicted RNase H-like HicB family nuclease